MVSLQPEVNPTGRYSIKETCEYLGIHRDTLRDYTEKHYIKCSFRKLSSCVRNDRRNTTPRKFYLGAEIIRFWRSQM